MSSSQLQHQSALCHATYTLSHVRKSLESLHPVQRRTHDDLQHHGVVRDAPLLVVVDVVFSPVARNAEEAHIVGKGACDERVQAHGERAAAAIALRAAVDEAQFRVASKRDVLV